MKYGKRALLAALMTAAAAAMAGCAAGPAPSVTFTPAVQQQTAQPETAQPGSSEAPLQEETQQLSLKIGEAEADAPAVLEHGELLLPLVKTGEALGWKVKSEDVEEETQLRRSVTMEKEGSRISVTWTVSDNTARQIVWQKDGLLIPVDTQITTMQDVVYVPAAFFEEAMDVRVIQGEKDVRLEEAQQKATPDTEEQEG